MSGGKTHFKTLVESDYLGQWDLPQQGSVVFVIERVEPFKPLQRKRVKDPRTGEMKQERQKRVEITLRGQRKHFLAGPVNQKTIASLYGRFIEDWLGKAIELYVDHSVEFGREVTGGIRVKPTIPRGAPTQRNHEAPVDPEKAAQIERARQQAEQQPAQRAREPGED